MYRAVERFRDLTDGHLYVAGEQFPHDGRDVPEERIEALQTGRNQAGKRLIERVDINIPPETKPRRKAVKTQKKGG